MGAFYKKELRAYFSNFTGYLVIAFMLAVIGIFSVSVNFTGRYPNFEYSLDSISFVLLFVIPILTMRSISEERNQKTDTLLYSLPVSMTKIVLGKYFAMMTVMALPIAFMCVYPLILSLYGTVSLSTAYSSILAFYLLTAALVAIGLFMSSLTENPIISAVLGFGALLFINLMTGLAEMVPATPIASFIAIAALLAAIGFLIYSMTKNYWLSLISAFAAIFAVLIFYLNDNSAFYGLFAKIINSLSIFDKLNIFIFSGIFDLTAAVYFITVAALFVFFTVLSMDKRRWN